MTSLIFTNSILFCLTLLDVCLLGINICLHSWWIVALCAVAVISAVCAMIALYRMCKRYDKAKDNVLIRLQTDVNVLSYEVFRLKNAVNTKILNK